MSEHFEILPAIDLKDGHCVRLRQGRADDATVYGADPVAQALEWVGARFLFAAAEIVTGWVLELF